MLDRVAERHGLAWETGPAEALQGTWRDGDHAVLLVKPVTFMNLSGEAVGALARFFKIDPADVLVVCDDVNLPLGRIRARAEGSEGGHNGLRSIAQHLGTTAYPRLRIGVGRGDLRRDLADHVLARFEPEELTGIEDAIARSADAVERWVRDGIGVVMNHYNRADG